MESGHLEGSADLVGVMRVLLFLIILLQRNTLGHLGPKLVTKTLRVFWGPSGHFCLFLFVCFLELGGSIWAITVLDEQSIPLRCSGHPTSLYFEMKNVPLNMGP